MREGEGDVREKGSEVNDRLYFRSTFKKVLDPPLLADII